MTNTQPLDDNLESLDENKNNFADFSETSKTLQEVKYSVTTWTQSLEPLKNEIVVDTSSTEKVYNKNKYSVSFICDFIEKNNLDKIKKFLNIPYAQNKTNAIECVFVWGMIWQILTMGSVYHDEEYIQNFGTKPMNVYEFIFALENPKLASKAIALFNTHPQMITGIDRMGQIFAKRKLTEISQLNLPHDVQAFILKHYTIYNPSDEKNNHFQKPVYDEYNKIQNDGTHTEEAILAIKDPQSFIIMLSNIGYDVRGLSIYDGNLVSYDANPVTKEIVLIYDYYRHKNAFFGSFIDRLHLNDSIVLNFIQAGIESYDHDLNNGKVYWTPADYIIDGMKTYQYNKDKVILKTSGDVYYFYHTNTGIDYSNLVPASHMWWTEGKTSLENSGMHIKAFSSPITKHYIKKEVSAVLSNPMVHGAFIVTASHGSPQAQGFSKDAWNSISRLVNTSNDQSYITYEDIGNALIERYKKSKNLGSDNVIYIGSCHSADFNQNVIDYVKSKLKNIGVDPKKLIFPIMISNSERGNLGMASSGMLIEIAKVLKEKGKVTIDDLIKIVDKIKNMGWTKPSIFMNSNDTGGMRQLSMNQDEVVSDRDNSNLAA